MTLADWLELVAYLGLKYPNQALDEPQGRAWYSGVAMLEQADVAAAIDRLSWKMAFRPALSDVLAEAKLVRTEHEPKLLAEPRPEPTKYSQGWIQLHKKAWGNKGLMATVLELAAKHDLWFKTHIGERATVQMRDEVAGLCHADVKQGVTLP